MFPVNPTFVIGLLGTLSAAIVALISGSFVLHGTFASIKQKKEELRQANELAQAQTQANLVLEQAKITQESVWKYIAVLLNDVKDMKADLDRRDGRIDELEQKVAVLTVENATLTWQNSEKERRITVLESELRDRVNEIAKHVGA